MTGEQILREYTPPPLFHGRSWGGWVLDVERLCLVFEGEPVLRGNGSGVTEGVEEYTAYLGLYEIDLERVRECAAMLDWLYQFRGKGWANARTMLGLVDAFRAIFDPQGTLCSGACGSGGGGMVIKNPGAFLRERIARVGRAEDVA
jgi:hypothetical protein